MLAKKTDHQRKKVLVIKTYQLNDNHQGEGKFFKPKPAHRAKKIPL